MSDEQSQSRVRERKREVLERPFRQGCQWIGTRLDGLRSKSASPRSTRPPTPQPTGLPPADAPPSPRNAAQELPMTEQLVPVRHPAHDALCSGTSVSPVTIEQSTSGDAPPSPFHLNRARDRPGETPQPDTLPQGHVLTPPQLVVSLTPPTQETLPLGLDQSPEVTAFPPIVRENSASLAHDRLPKRLSPYSPPPLPLPHFDDKPPQTVNYGPVFNVGVAGNVFSGVNYGSVTMISDDDFARSYLDQLKVSIKADHMYYANGDEAALRRGECTPGTRIDILQGVMLWATNISPTSARVYWLSGQAGAGKTTIAYTIARHFETLRVVSDGKSRAMLGASFFCSRQFLDTRSASSIIRTIVYQLALRSKPFQIALKEYGRFETVNHGPRSQLMDLLVVPWEKSAPQRLADSEPCYVIPIDALDELEGTGGTELLASLFDVVDQQDLSGLKFFVTSRSEPALVKKIASFSNKQVCRLEEVPFEESSADIRLYLNENLVECADEHQIQQLVSDAAGLFIYAATVIEYVKGRDLDEQRSLLKRLLSAPSPSIRQPSLAATATLDNLYIQVLNTSLVDPRERDDPETFRDCLSILHTFLCTIERTSTSTAVDILNASEADGSMVLDTGMANGVLHRLHAILYSQGGQVMTFHKSFADFLFDERRSQKFFCNQEHHHRRLTDGCFQIMARQLRFNITKIPSSYQLDRNNPALPTSIARNISAPLRYACGSWSAHLTLTPFRTLDGLTEILNEFLELRGLFWMEAMNLLGHRGRCQGMLRNAQQWPPKSKDSTELVGKLADAAAFAAYHSASEAALSTPHLYLSSLATFPRHSAIVQSWRQQVGGIPGFIGAHRAGGTAMVACITLIDRYEMNALAVSPNGSKVAVGSGDSSIRVWDLSTAEEVRVLKGHTAPVCAVAYSPDGTYLVSGSDNKSVRVWDLATGEEIVALQGHTEGIVALTFFRDGTRVVSGSCDESFRVWDIPTEKEVMILKGHTTTVLRAACSPDGTQFASCLVGNLVHIKNISTGEGVAVLKGHTDPVSAVTYSPNGTHLASGSNDCSIRVWDVCTGEEVRVLVGHHGWVLAVAFSPDGTHLVSGSTDRSVRVWNVSAGEVVRVLQGHTCDVDAVAYCPDGTHVVSGANYDSLRVWDLSAGDVWEEERVLEGHTGMVAAVAYSPDETQIVSGSFDGSIRVWDSSIGQGVKVLKGHTDWVNALAYSPDGTHLISASSNEFSGSCNESVWVWDLSTGRGARVLEGSMDKVWAVASSPHGIHVVSGSSDNSIRVWDVSTGQEARVLNGHTSTVYAVACSRDGTHAVSASDDKSLRVWDLSSGEEVSVLKGHTGRVLSIAYSPDGSHIVSGSYVNSIWVWDLFSGEVKVLNGHTAPVHAVAYSPDGTHLVSGSDDKSLRIWDMSTLEEARALKGQTGKVRAVAYSPNGNHIVYGIGSRDNSVRVWNVSPEYTPRYIRQQGPDGECTGWLVCPSDPSAYLMFVQPEALLPDDFNILTLPTSAVAYLDFSDAKFGTRWAQCYTPRSL